jgi:broad specificity phosphatase PhoE
MSRSDTGDDYREDDKNRLLTHHPSNSKSTWDRRDILHHFSTSLSAIVASTVLAQIIAPAAHAMGLMKFPCLEPLHNSYHFLRAGISLLEEQDIWSTNPLFLTNREAALSPLGRQQVLEAVKTMAEHNIQPSQIRHSLAASAMDTAGIVRDELKVGQNRINPEFVFLDPRAIGAWEGMALQSTQAAVAALDQTEAGAEGREGRPPPNDDGTPNETLFDQSTRLRQVMSALETQYSGDTILLVFPDGTGPALLSAMMAGIPLNQVHVLEYEPGELRMDVTRQSTLDLFRQRQEQGQEKYTASIHRGQEELQRLRSLDMTTIVSRKDQLLEQEQMAIEKEYRTKKEAQRKKEEEAEQARLARQRQIGDARRKREEDAERARLAKQPMTNQNSGMTTKSIDPNVAISGILAGAVIGGLSMVAFGSNDDAKQPKDPEKDKSSKQKLSEQEGDDTIVTSTSMREPQKSTGKAVDVNQATVQRPSLYGDSAISNNKISYQVTQPPPPPPLTEEDRREAARLAMEDYLNQDDGGEDWLEMMNQLLVDEEDVEAVEDQVAIKENDSLSASGFDTQDDPQTPDTPNSGAFDLSMSSSWEESKDVGKWQ